MWRTLLSLLLLSTVASATEPEVTDIPPVTFSPAPTPPRVPPRSPSMSVTDAIERSQRFLREHGYDPSKYYVSLAIWACSSEKPEEDAWRVDWVARDKATKPQKHIISVHDETHVFFGAEA